ncbi:MAG TPA: Ig-like domain-containing protein [Gemmatimonadaceae bacterium]|nr:Ig-like domain-containing protein [Gemmatimonadaceae bacterium]
MSSRRSFASVAGFAVIIACLFATASCDDPLAREVDDVDRVVLTPTTANLQAGTTLTLMAVALDAAGNELRDRRVVWASQNETIATVSQSGVVTGLTAGVVQIAASSGGKSASATITVTARPVTLVRLTPGSGTIAVGSSITLQAEALDASGAPVLGRPVGWASLNEAVATVSNSGVVVGVAVGSTTITATIDGRSGTAAITVAPQPVASVVITPTSENLIVGQRFTFRATALNAQNVALPDRIAFWSSNNPSVATVTSEGEVLALAVGTARIRATIEGKFADANVTVAPVPVATVAVTPNQVTLNPGQTSQLIVTLTDAAGNVLTGRTINYSTSDAQIATVSNSGLVTAVAQGNAQIQVTSEGKSATAAITVNATPIASIVVTPNAISLQVAHATTLSAQALDAQGRPLTGRTFTWSSSAPGVATVDQSGSVTGVSSGSATISASSGGQTGTSTVTVTNVFVASVVISPKTASVVANSQQQFTVQLLDANGGSLGQSGRTVTWVSRDPAIATVNSSGLMTAVAAGQTRIVATTIGATALVGDSATVTVTPAPPTSMTVQTQATNIYIGQTIAMRAIIVDAGSIVRNRTVTWVSRNPGVVTVAAVSGFPDSANVSGVALGSAYIVVSDPSGLQDSSLVNVAPVPVAAVSVIPATSTLVVSGTAQLTAVATDSVGNVLTPTITWVSQAPSVASVSNTGLVTANASGTATIEARANGAGANGVDVVGTASLTISPPAQAPVATVTVTSPRSYIVPGDTMHLTVVLRDAQNNILTGRPITFASNSPSRQTVDATGIVTGLGTSGSATITATSEGKTGQVQISSKQPVATIRLTGPAGNASDLVLSQNTTKRYTVTLLDSNGNDISNIGISVSANPASLVTLSATSITTNGQGRAQVDVRAGSAPGLVTLNFTVLRAGAIPPGTPGNNSPVGTLPLVIP